MLTTLLINLLFVTNLPSPLVATPPDHSLWTALLQAHVDQHGSVNYQGFKQDQVRLKSYLNQLARTPVNNNWPRNEQLAYWINAYNACTIQLIVEHYPVSSIMDIEGGKAWDLKWITLGQKTYSLNEIENEIIRPQFQEPRIHFALNCAARSCPPLLNRAWTAAQLEKDLEQRTRAFINHPDYNTIQPQQVKISQLFSWYAGDFGQIIDFLNRYSTTSIRSGAKLTFLEYDWRLNE